MSEPARLEESAVAVGGLGLMGGSIALALRGRCRRLLGWDPDPAVVDLALETRAVDEAERLPDTIVARADLIVLAAPVAAIIDLLARLPSMQRGSPMILDLGSTKSAIVEAMAALPSRFDPIGGHPMCGKETPGLVNSQADLFQGAPFALTALPRTTARARGLAEQLVTTIGACPLWIDAATHDRWVAATSHVPFLIAAALVLATPEESLPLAGPGLWSTSRLAASDPKMMLDILQTNRPAVLAALGAFRGELEVLESALARSADDQMGDRLTTAAARRRGPSFQPRGSAA